MQVVGVSKTVSSAIGMGRRGTDSLAIDPWENVTFIDMVSPVLHLNCDLPPPTMFGCA